MARLEEDAARSALVRAERGQHQVPGVALRAEAVRGEEARAAPELRELAARLALEGSVHLRAAARSISQGKQAPEKGPDEFERRQELEPRGDMLLLGSAVHTGEILVRK